MCVVMKAVVMRHSVLSATTATEISELPPATMAMAVLIMEVLMAVLKTETATMVLEEMKMVTGIMVVSMIHVVVVR